MKTIALALTGASGMIYAERLLAALLASECRVFLVYSQAAQIVMQQELSWHLPADAARAEQFFHDKYSVSGEKLRVFGRKAWFAPIASGSNPPDAMVICPCTMGTLAKVAQGFADDLLTRAADVCLKERRTLILVPRETPFSLIHLENMTRLAKAGAVILPPNPAFYHAPKSLDELVHFVVARILDQLNLPQSLVSPWGETF